jgi:hypothetical protein
MDYVYRISSERQNDSTFVRNMTASFSNPSTVSALTGIIIASIVIIYYGKELFSIESITGFIRSIVSSVTSASSYILIIYFIIIILVFTAFMLYTSKADEYSASQGVTIYGSSSPFASRIEKQSNMFKPSENKPGGSEFTYSMGVYIHKLGNRTDGPMRLLQKGSGDLSQASGQKQRHSPTVTIGHDGTMTVYVTTIQEATRTTESFELQGIPIKKDFHLIVALSGRNVDVLIDGVLAKRHRLKGIPELNNDTLKLCPATPSSYVGQLWKVRYFRRYLLPNEIEKISIDDLSGKSATAPVCN